MNGTGVPEVKAAAGDAQFGEVCVVIARAEAPPIVKVGVALPPPVVVKAGLVPQEKTNVTALPVTTDVVEVVTVGHPGVMNAGVEVGKVKF